MHATELTLAMCVACVDVSSLLAGLLTKDCICPASGLRLTLSDAALHEAGQKLACVCWPDTAEG